MLSCQGVMKSRLGIGCYFGAVAGCLVSLPLFVLRPPDMGTNFILVAVPSIIATIIGFFLSQRFIDSPESERKKNGTRLGKRVALWSCLIFFIFCLVPYGSLTGTCSESCGINEIIRAASSALVVFIVIVPIALLIGIGSGSALEVLTRPPKS